MSFPVFLSSLNISTLKMALGMASRTMPSISITSSLDKLFASSLDLLSLSLNLNRCLCLGTLKAPRFSRACARLTAACRFSVLQFQCRSTDGQAAMIATYFIFRGTKSAKRAENPCPPRKYLASTAIYRLYTFCCQFARAFFRISDKKFSKFKSCPFSPRSWFFSTAKMKLFHQKLS